MKIKTFPIEKKDVEKLSDETLLEFVSFKTSDLYKALRQISEGYKVRLGQQALKATDISQLQLLSGTAIGVDFILDTVIRAEEELTSRQTQKVKKK